LRGSKARLSGKLSTFTIYPLVENARGTARVAFIVHSVSSGNEGKFLRNFDFSAESKRVASGLPTAFPVMLDGRGL